MEPNLFAITAREKLTPQELFERYLNWRIFCDQYGESRIHEICDRELFSSFLCCEFHFRYKAENDTFFRYFVHLKMIDSLVDDFDIHALARMIHKSKLEITPSIKEKLRIYCGYQEHEFFTLLAK